MRLLNTVVSGSDASSDDSPRKLLPRMDTELFNDNDEECIEYVRDFKAKVVVVFKQIEQKYGKSQLNRDYEFPRRNLKGFGSSQISLDSERSLESLNGVTFYLLDSQNDKRPFNPVERLAASIKVLGKLSINELRHQFR